MPFGGCDVRRTLGQSGRQDCCPSGVPSVLPELVLPHLRAASIVLLPRHHRAGEPDMAIVTYRLAHWCSLRPAIEGGIDARALVQDTGRPFLIGQILSSTSLLRASTPPVTFGFRENRHGGTRRCDGNDGDGNGWPGIPDRRQTAGHRTKGPTKSTARGRHIAEWPVAAACRPAAAIQAYSR